MSITNQKTLPPLSQSRQALMACPHLYAETIIHGRVEPDNQYAARGREVHDFLRDYVRFLVNGGESSSLIKFDEMLVTRGLSQDAQEILQQLRDSVSIDPEQVLACEQRLYLDKDFNAVIPDEDEETIDDNDRAAFACYEGKPDLILLLDPSTAKIPDYKSQYQIEPADTFQGKLYALLVMCHYSFVQKVIFELQFVRYGTAARSVEYTREQLPLLKKAAERERRRQVELHNIDSGILAGNAAPAMPGDHCAWCPKLHKGCPVAEVNPYTNQTPEDRLRFELWAKAALRVNDQALKAHVNAAGPVQIADGNGHEYRREFIAKERTTFPLVPTLDVITKWIQAGGDDFTDKLAIRSTKLKQYLKAKKRSGLADHVAEVAITEQYTRWSLSGVDQDEEEDGSGQ